MGWPPRRRGTRGRGARTPVSDVERGEERRGERRRERRAGRRRGEQGRSLEGRAPGRTTAARTTARGRRGRRGTRGAARAGGSGPGAGGRRRARARREWRCARDARCADADADAGGAPQREASQASLSARRRSGCAATRSQSSLSASMGVPRRQWRGSDHGGRSSPLQQQIGIGGGEAMGTRRRSGDGERTGGGLPSFFRRESNSRSQRGGEDKGEGNLGE